jgi:hypothetical protein
MHILFFIRDPIMLLQRQFREASKINSITVYNKKHEGKKRDYTGKRSIQGDQVLQYKTEIRFGLICSLTSKYIWRENTWTGN